MDNRNDNNRNNRRPIGGGQNNNSYAKYGSNMQGNGYNNYNQQNNRRVAGGGPNYNQPNNRRMPGNNYDQIRGLSQGVGNNERPMVEGDGMGNNILDPLEKKKLIKKRIKLGIKIFFVSLLLGIIIAGVVVYAKYGKDILAMRDDAILKVQETTAASFKRTSQHKYYGVKTNSNGEKEYVELDMGSGNGKYISTSEGGENMVLARELMICSEDRNYYSHKGVDLWASGKAVILAIMNGGEATRGGSTITQQLARNVILNDFDKTWKRKVREIFISWELNDKFEKDEIIEFYLNNINFANGYRGIENAAYGYFGKSVKDLTKGQVAFLCSIPNNPALFNPYNLTSNEKYNKQDYKVNYNTSVRKNRLLEQMNKYSKSKLDKADYTAALNEKIEVNAQSDKKSDDNGDKYTLNMALKSYITDCVYDKIIKQSIKTFTFEYADEWVTEEDKKAYLERYEEAQNRAYNLLKQSKDTLHIYTSIDIDMVNKLQETIDNRLDKRETEMSAKDKNIYKVQSAGVTIDNSGYVVAMVNGRTTKNNIVDWNARAYNIQRQPGSSIKPLVVYAPYFELNKDKEGFCFLDERVEDEHEIKFDDGSKSIRNSKSVLSQNVREAIKYSSNVVAYKTLVDKEKVGVSKGMSFLKKMNFSHFTQKDMTNSRVCIGASDGGVTPLEMCAAYSYILMDMSGYIRPTCVKVISNKKLVSASEVDTHVQAKQAGERTIFSNDTKSRIIDGMQSVFDADGTAHDAKVNGTWQVSGKTGTTDNNVDSWFCGGTPKYTTAIWVGNGDGWNGKTSTSGPTVSTIWADYYNSLAQDRRIKAELDSEPSFKFKFEYQQTILPNATEAPEATIDPESEIPMPSETTFTFPPYSSDDPDRPDPYNPNQTATPEPGLPTIPGDDDDDDSDTEPPNNNNNNNNNGNHGGHIGGNP